MFYRQLLEQLRAIPGVTSASASTGMPVNGTGFGMPFSIVGKPVDRSVAAPGAGFNMVTPEYFGTFGIPMQRGRAFTEQDSAGAPRVAIVNDAFVRQYLTGLDPLKQRLVIEAADSGRDEARPAVEWQIVGVYRAVRNAGPRGDFPEIDVPFAQSPWPATSVAVRTAVDPDGAREPLRRPCRRSIRICRWRTSRRWTSACTNRWPAIVSRRCCSAASRAWRWSSRPSASTA